MTTRLFIIGLIISLSSIIAAAQQTGTSTPEGDTVCTFQDGSQIDLRYDQVRYDKKSEPPAGKVWQPNQRPMYLFSQAELTVAGTNIPPGAYSVYVIPANKQWTLIINRDVTKGATYSQQQDIARLPMETAQLPSPAANLVAYFGHEAPKQCVLRLDYGKTRAYATLQQK